MQIRTQYLLSVMLTPDTQLSCFWLRLAHGNSLMVLILCNGLLRTIQVLQLPTETIKLLASAVAQLLRVWGLLLQAKRSF